MPSSLEPVPEINFGFSLEPEPELIEIFSDLESDCGYMGGVNYHGFDSDDEFEPGSDGCWSDSDAAPSKYDLIAAVKTSQEWKMAEKKRGFGYTSNSQCTKQHNAEAAHEKEIACKIAKNSCTDLYSLC